jgi:hypothetical protein
MKSLFNQTDKTEILTRIDKLSPSSQRQWGKMDVAQMLAHCNAALETAAGLTFPSRVFLGRILAPFMKARFVSEKPFRKNYPTHKSYRFNTPMNFQDQKLKVVSLIKQFSENGMEKATTHPHSFYGKLTPEQWGIVMYKHFDHHLRQFGV